MTGVLVGSGIGVEGGSVAVGGRSVAVGSAPRAGVRRGTVAVGAISASSMMIKPMTTAPNVKLRQNSPIATSPNPPRPSRIPCFRSPVRLSFLLDDTLNLPVQDLPNSGRTSPGLKPLDGMRGLGVYSRSSGPSIPSSANAASPGDLLPCLVEQPVTTDELRATHFVPQRKRHAPLSFLWCTCQ